jgi:hypothetical protein
MPASPTYSGQSLIADVRRRAMIPNSTSVLSDSDILSFLNDEMLEYIVPLLIGTAEEYLVVSSVEFSSDTALIDLNGGRYFDIPAEAVGGKLRDFQVQSINSWISLPRVEPENASQFFTYGALQGYLFQGKRVYMVPIPTAAATLRFLYYARPAEITNSATDLATPGYAGERIPADLWPLLAQRAVVRCLEALGDERAEAAEARCARVEAKCIELISPRGEGAPRVITNFWGPGWTYRRRGYYWGR